MQNSQKNEQKTVFLMMSGGVDSSVAAAVLQEQGYQVIGVFMKCWSIEQLESIGASRELYGCFWEDDSDDARSVAHTLGIPFYVWDFQDEYKQKVVDYMLGEYQNGRTPNPDVMCNSFIKFGIFYRQARQLGADFVATGHYARRTFQAEYGEVIARGQDSNKDQTYFIWGIQKDQIPHILFPVGDFATKAEVRQRAEKDGLITAHKKDSQGLCFIGDTPLRELLIQTIGQKEGDIVDIEGNILGKHPGAFLYTIGQRQKLGLSGGPWFVSRIDVEKNQVIVAHDSDDQVLYTSELTAIHCNWQVDQNTLRTKKTLQTQIRYRQQSEDCQLEFRDKDSVVVRFTQPVRAVAKGQSIVFYDNEILLGGGVIE